MCVHYATKPIRRLTGTFNCQHESMQCEYITNQPMGSLSFSVIEGRFFAHSYHFIQTTERHMFDNKERKSTGEVSNISVWMFYSINNVQC